MAPLTDPDFDRVRALAFDGCGLSLHEGKRALVSSRLEGVVRRRGFGSFTSYLAFLSQSRTSDEFTEFIDTLTTHHSSFWREPAHFTFLRDTIMAERRSRLRVWSAACATGEEPYTIAMCALESGIANCDVTATDISRAALHRAIGGRYEPAKVAPLPASWRERYLQASFDDGWSVAEPARRLISFSTLNLLKPFLHLGTFEVIFCRNVMIYFDHETRDKLVDDLSARLAPGGYLFTGHSETLRRPPPGLKYVHPAIYRKV